MNPELPKVLTNNASLAELVQDATDKELVTPSLTDNTPLDHLGKTGNKYSCHVVVVDYGALPTLLKRPDRLTELLQTTREANGMKIVLINYDDQKMIDRFRKAGHILDYVLPGQVDQMRLETTIGNAYQVFLGERDHLTKLFNRRYLDAKLEKALEQAKESLSPVSVSLFDLDHFKQINDTYGHDAGDEALRQFTTVLKASCHGHERDTPGRQGGEEFLVVSTKTPLVGSYLLAERVRKATVELCLPIPEHDKPLRFTVSGGVYSYNGVDKGMEVRTLLRAADKQLYAAKQAGRNRICGYTP